MRVGFIGTGSMGSILIDAFLSSHVLDAEQLIITNRTLEKAVAISRRHPGITVVSDNLDVVHKSDFILLCVKPREYQVVLEQLKGALSQQQVLITITSPVQLSELESCVPCQVVRAVPSITNAVHSGLTLIQFGSRTTEETRQQILRLFSAISHPVETEERFLRITADITGCGPAFISYLSQQMIRASVEVGGISAETATFLTSQMLIGIGELLKQEAFTLPALQERVCVPGGITGEALAVMDQHLPGVFQHVFVRTQEKFAEDLREMSEQLQRVSSDRQ